MSDLHDRVRVLETQVASLQMAAPRGIPQAEEMPGLDRARRERFELMSAVSAVVAKAGGEVRLTDGELVAACGYQLERIDHVMGGVTLRVVKPAAHRTGPVSDDVCTCVELPGALCPVCHAGVGR